MHHYSDMTRPYHIQATLVALAASRRLVEWGVSMGFANQEMLPKMEVLLNMFITNKIARCCELSDISIINPIFGINVDIFGVQYLHKMSLTIRAQKMCKLQNGKASRLSGWENK